MKKNLWAILAAVIGILFLTAGTRAEWSAKGSGEYRSGKSGTFEILKLGEERLQMNWDEQGAMVDVPENSPFVNTSYRAIGTLHAINGKWKGHGAIIFTCPNGDQIYGIIESEGELGIGPNSGYIELIGGTGACSGIKGRIDFTPRPKLQSSKQGTYQGIGTGKISWELP